MIAPKQPQPQTPFEPKAVEKKLMRAEIPQKQALKTVALAQEQQASRELQRTFRTVQRFSNPEPNVKATATAIMAANFLLNGKIATDSEDPKVHEYVAELVGSKATSTWDSYASNWFRWVDNCERRKISPLPVDPEDLRIFINTEKIRLQTDKLSASSLQNLESAIKAVSNAAGTADPYAPPRVQVAMEAAKRTLGFRKQPKVPLVNASIRRAVEGIDLTSISLQQLGFYTWLQVAYEGALRWNDLCSVRFGLCLWCEDIVRIFLTRTKTDQYLSGQWVSIPNQKDCYAASQLLQCLWERLQVGWQKLPQKRRETSAYAETGELCLMETPLVFELSADNTNPEFPVEPSAFKQHRAYNAFNQFVKGKACEQGIEPSSLATQSMRRGQTTDKKMSGVEDRIIKHHGRWRSEQAYQGYIDELVSLRSLVGK